MPRARSQPSPTRPDSVAWDRLPDLPPGLTPPQREILPLLATELTHDEIGHLLGLGAENVKAQSRRLYTKLGARTRHGALLQWLRPDLYPKGRLPETRRIR
ncbi:MAG: helix-turn-helix transcriptional regulator [Verrucomicrobiae bacterium]|nr:helix-turn-helix transcriptional regulator [Verrucomicrobiae bacterium]